MNRVWPILKLGAWLILLISLVGTLNQLLIYIGFIREFPIFSNTSTDGLIQFAPNATQKTKSTFEVFLEDQEKRKSMVKNVCQSNLRIRGEGDVSLSRLLIQKNKRKKLAYCPIYKVASTSLTNMMNELQGNNVFDLFDLKALAKYFSVEKILSGSTAKRHRDKTKFIAVRHPLERALSCYRDKHENVSKPYYYKLYGESMVNRYRHIPANISEIHRTQMLKEVREYVLSKGKKGKISPGNIYAKPLGATFQEFVKFIIRNPWRDEHWRPYHVSCRPCDLDYDFIIKFENLKHETGCMLEALNRTDVKLAIKGANPGGKTNAVLCTYLANLSEGDFSAFVNIYTNDFELFGYDHKQYYKCVRKKGEK